MRVRGPSTLMTLREITTPEGVSLPFEIASGGDRAAGFFLDSLIQFVLIVIFWMVVGSASRAGDEGWMLALLLLVFFFLRNFYFTWFELRWQGATPGKRVTRTRVMDADGGPLRADAVLVRNLMRELEVWLPLSVVFAPDHIWPDAPAWARVVSGLWAVAFAFLPLFNRHRMRVGDMVAGTIVVRAPRAVLFADLGGKEVRRSTATYRFTDRQLDVYGIYELQVLEDLLRRKQALYKDQALRAVCGRIQKKIKWEGGQVQTERFLREFYAALRARLEQKMLLGKRKEDKYSREE
jgi:uncharacterized RDD family membrane protein YckC